MSPMITREERKKYVSERFTFLAISDAWLLIDKIYDDFINWVQENEDRTKPKIVCLCGSTKFEQAFKSANREESLKGNIVLSVAMFGHNEGLDMTGPEKHIFDELHMRKIDLADEILVLNVGGYIGESTAREISYAKSIFKPIRYLE